MRHPPTVAWSTADTRQRDASGWAIRDDGVATGRQSGRGDSSGSGRSTSPTAPSPRSAPQCAMLSSSTLPCSTRSRTLGAPVQLTDSVYQVALEVFQERVRLEGHRVRLLGVGLSNLIVSQPRQLDMLDGPVEKRAQRVEAAVDAIRGRLGRGAITRGRLLGRKGRRS